MIRKQTILWVAVIVVVAGLVWFLGIAKGKIWKSLNGNPVVTVEPSSSASPTADQSGSFNKYPPAQCSLTGSIKFISPGIYENKDANIIYKNIDSIARLITWKISPDDGLIVGPNLFVNLPLPHGTEDVTVGLPENPKSKNYTLTAKVNYGVVVNGNLEIRESNCSGKIPVEIKY